MDARPERTRQIEEDNCDVLLQFWDRVLFGDVKPSVLDDCFQWRRQRVKKGMSGRRSTDMELNTLNNAMHWAHRREQIRFNPMPHSRARYNNKKHVKHCRESCPADAEVLHQFAKYLFQVPGRRSKCLGWQMLIEAMTGRRTCEALLLRTDAKKGRPGYISPEGCGSLFTQDNQLGTAGGGVHPIERTMLDEL